MNRELNRLNKMNGEWYEHYKDLERDVYALSDGMDYTIDRNDVMVFGEEGTYVAQIFSEDGGLVCGEFER